MTLTCKSNTMNFPEHNRKLVLSMTVGKSYQVSCYPKVDKKFMEKIFGLNGPTYNGPLTHSYYLLILTDDGKWEEIEIPKELGSIEKVMDHFFTS